MALAQFWPDLLRFAEVAKLSTRLPAYVGKVGFRTMELSRAGKELSIRLR